MNKTKLLIIGGIILAVIAFGYWIYTQSVPEVLPGTKIADLGRGHVPIGTKEDYNSNPPTSGPHYADWTKAGVYDAPLDDRNLVHSLEHGYVIMSYNCNYQSRSNSEATSSAKPATASAQTNTPDCQSLVSQLKGVYEGEGKRKLIVIPRPNLDSKIALSAWNYLDKFNDFDKKRIEKFIDGHRDKGPEQTME